MADTNDVLDLVVIGGGPAGYVAAIRAAQLGLSVACVERDKLGGVCLNWGCIPTKALLAGAEMYSSLHHDAASFGIEVKDVSYDWEKVIGRSRGVAGQLNKGVGFLFKKHKIQHVDGHAYLAETGDGTASKPATVEVYDPADVSVAEPDHPDMPGKATFGGKPKQTLKAAKVLICTGATPRSLPGTPFDGERVLAAKHAMVLPERPKKLLIIGSGAIGMEFAYFYNAFGTEVTVVEMLDRVLPVEDREVSAAVEKAFKKQGVTLLTGHKTESIEVTDAGVKAVVRPVETEGTHAQHPAKKSYSAQKPKEQEADAHDAGEAKTIEADHVLVAIGVRGRFYGLFPAKLGLELHKQHLKVDYRREHPDYQTNLPGVYAVGDVIGPPWLAHVASEEAIVCVERMAGHHADDVDYESVPGCTHCHPQVASIGYTQQRAEEEGLDFKTGTFPFQASGKAQALGETTGFVKLITGAEHGEILGAHMVGDGVTELIAEMGLARRLEATADEVIATMHAHPTMSEAVHEAALGTDGRMIHA